MSALILGIAISPMIFSINMSRMNAAKTRHYVEAMNHARAAMEEFINAGTIYVLPPGDIGTLNGTCVVAVNPIAPNIDRVLVTVAWDERGMGNATNRVSVELVTEVRN